MRKICLAFSMVLFLFASVLSGCGSTGEKQETAKGTKVVLNEVAHSVVCADKGSIERY